MAESRDIRTRFAPSPTGYLHVGGGRTALFNYLFAKSQGGKFILRIEDTDQKRSTAQATEQVIASLKWLKIDWDEGPDADQSHGPYYQSQRLSIYRKYLQHLLEDEKVYRCFCTDGELQKTKKRSEAMGIPYVYDGKCRHLSQEEIEKKIKEGIPYTYRFYVKPREIIFEDLIRGKIKFDSRRIGDFVICKADGYPTYNFAVVIDDALMNISHVIRGDDHISNTPRQILLYEALNFPLPVLCHISMILGPDGEKMSKRHGATSVMEFKIKGYLPDPLVNFLALLGWSPEDGIEIISREKLMHTFSTSKFSKSPAVFEFGKLDYLNGYHLHHAPLDEVFPLFLPYLQTYIEKNGYRKHSLASEGEEKFRKIVGMVRTYCKKLSDIEAHLPVFFEDNFNLSEESREYVKNEKSRSLLELTFEYLKSLEEEALSKEIFKALMQAAKEKLYLTGKNFFKPLRAAITGKVEGMELDMLFQTLGRKALLARLRNTLDQL